MTEIMGLLEEKFGFQTFKPGQKETIESVLVEAATFSILPTGTGKSLCYQLPSYLLKGTTVIVSPLLSLMEDQVQQLRMQGEKNAIAINSHLSFKEKQWALAHLHQYQFIFFSPETLLQEEVHEALKQIMVSLFVVDEAHCISQWGIDFRPEYERLHQIIAAHNIPKVLALTATATAKVSADIKQKLFLKETISEIRYSVNRPNIAYEVVKTKEKLPYIKDYLQRNYGTGIIYFSSKKEAERVAGELGRETNQRVAFYHGGMTQQERSIVQQQFLNDQLDVLCATSAFGMGINKAAIRFIIHYHLPASLEAYLQESGRAGRDGEQSHSIVFYQEGDEQIHYFLQAELQAEIKEFEAFKSINPDQKQTDYSHLSELQQKWLAGYLNNTYSLESLATNLKDKQQQKQRQLSSLLEYLDLETCRREYLLAYFGDEQITSQQYCCDNCGFSTEILVSSSLKPKKSPYLVKNWEEKLKNLFII